LYLLLVWQGAPWRHLAPQFQAQAQRVRKMRPQCPPEECWGAVLQALHTLPLQRMARVLVQRAAWGVPWEAEVAHWMLLEPPPRWLLE
jgi:hypothetical protein